MRGAPCAKPDAGQPKIGCRAVVGTTKPQGLRITVSGAKPGVAAMLIVGGSDTSHHGVPLPWSLQPLGLDCLLRPSSDLVLLGRTGTKGLDAGYARFDLGVTASLHGAYPMFAQWVTFDAGRVSAVSDTLTMRVDPR